MSQKTYKYTFAAFCVLALLWLSLSPAQLYAEPDPPFTLPPRAELIKIKSGVIFTNKGKLYFELFPQSAPWHVANFKYLADKGFYRNLPFHLYEENYHIQTGAPNPRAASGPGYTLPAEFNPHKHVEGTLSMVRRPDDLDLDHMRRSHGSQFRILLRPAPHMDGQYTVFGQVVRGLNVLEQLRKGDTILDIRVFVRTDEGLPVSAGGYLDPGN